MLDGKKKKEKFFRKGLWQYKNNGGERQWKLCFHITNMYVVQWLVMLDV